MSKDLSQNVDTSQRLVIGGIIMHIEELKYRVRDIVRGFIDDAENGVRAFGGNLDVRPPYQREFIYSDDKQKKVIDTVIKGYPLNVFYWGTTDIPGQYEMIDGQQRTMSICRFVRNQYSVEFNGNDCNFSSLPQDIQSAILDYELVIYKCDGQDSEKLAWFETINIASEALTQQELRNAVYTGPWLADAKRYFSRSNCPAMKLAGDYLRGQPIRQEILEEVLRWASNAVKMKIDDYMALHKHDGNAEYLWTYFQDVIRWVRSVFGSSFRDMKGVSWGTLYNKYHEQHYVDESGNILSVIDGNKCLHQHSDFLKEIERLQDDEDVTSRVGIYEYVLLGDVRKLSIRKFPDKIKSKKYKMQGGLCALCHKRFELKDMVADHITPWSQGGRTIEGNCQLLCIGCNSGKSAKKETAVNEVPCKNCAKPVKPGMFCQFCGTKN